MGVGGGGSSFIEEIGFFGHTVSSLWFVGSLLWPVGAFFRCGPCGLSFVVPCRLLATDR